MTYYAYLHIKPEGRLEDIFYVGKGTEKRVALLSRKNRHHTNIVNKYGKENILVKTMECSTEAAAFELEVGLIKCLKRMGVELCNQTDGGEGVSGYVPTEEAKEKNRIAHANPSVEKREQMGRANIGNKYCLGRKVSEETRLKMGVTRRGIPLTQEHRLKISSAAIGRPRTPEHQAKLTAHLYGNTRRVGYKVSEEVKQRMSDSQKGRVLETEHKAKLTAAARRVKPPRKTNTSGHTGISWVSNKWRASIVVDGKCIVLGSSLDIEEAVTLRKAGELKYWGVEA